MCNERVVRSDRTTELMAEIEKQAEQFFEWPGERTDTVTYTSALLFAEHCVREAMRDGLRQDKVDRLGGK